MKKFVERMLSKIVEYDSPLPNTLYKKCKKDIVPPKRKFACYKNSSNKYIQDLHLFYDSFIQWSDVDWKTKFGNYRFEWLPYFAIRLFGWNFVWWWESPNESNSRYYEFILNYLYEYGKDAQKTLKNNKWQRLVDGKWVDIDSSVYIKNYKNDKREEQTA